MSPLLSTLGSGSAKGLGRALRPFIIKPSISSPANNATEQSSSSLSFSASAAQIVGKGTPHQSSDWQIASNSNFATIVASTTSDTTNKTSWVASGLSLNTTFYARVRYKDSTNLVSDYSDTITFTVEDYLPSLANGTSDITVANSSSTNFTVPVRIGRIKVQMKGGGGGQGSQSGYVDVSFDVVPGQIFTFAKTANNTERISYPKGIGGSTTAFWISDGTTDITQAKLWAIVGGGGGDAGDGGPPWGYGGAGGSDTAGGGGGYYGEVAGGGTQSAGGSGINNPYGWGSTSINYDGSYSPRPCPQPNCGPSYTATPGTAIYGGLCAKNNPHRDDHFGNGGNGWYGGCGGLRWNASSYWTDEDGNPQNSNAYMQSGGGGGSSRIQVPSPRNPTTTANQKGTSGTPNLTTGIKVTY